MNQSCAKWKLIKKRFRVRQLDAAFPCRDLSQRRLDGARPLLEDVRVGIHNNSMRKVAVLKPLASLRKRHQAAALQNFAGIATAS
ncbi:MAG: hypothetical protein DMG06_09675 [Acidobacteria bacterium]|nr:MAG: hypothetical protein DMG06_09675 [Acidobacteriota bacterium]